MKENKNCIIIIDDSFDVIEYANKHIPKAVWCSCPKNIGREQIEFFESFNNVIIAFGGDDFVNQKANHILEVLSENNISCQMLKYDILKHPINFKEPMQRRFVINQIKTAISNE